MSKNVILDQPRSEVAHREISRFSRLPTPGLVTDACMSVLGSSIVTFSHLYTHTHTHTHTATHTHSFSHTHTHTHSVTDRAGVGPLFSPGISGPRPGHFFHGSGNRKM